MKGEWLIEDQASAIADCAVAEARERRGDELSNPCCQFLRSIMDETPIYDNYGAANQETRRRSLTIKH